MKGKVAAEGEHSPANVLSWGFTMLGRKYIQISRREINHFIILKNVFILGGGGTTLIWDGQKKMGASDWPNQVQKIRNDFVIKGVSTRLAKICAALRDGVHCWMTVTLAARSVPQVFNPSLKWL